MSKSKVGQAGPHRSERDETDPRLAALLRQHQEELALAWAELVRRMQGSLYGDLPPEDPFFCDIKGMKSLVVTTNESHGISADNRHGRRCPHRHTHFVAAIAFVSIVPFVQLFFALVCNRSLPLWSTAQRDPLIGLQF